MRKPRSERFELVLDGVTKIFARDSLHPALKDLSLRAAADEWITIVGPSGSGKTTLLRIVANLDKPTHGMLSWVTAKAPPRIAFVAQRNTLFPWLTVQENVALPFSPSASNRERLDRASAYLTEVGLTDATLWRRFPYEVSGGQARRVAIAMALAAGCEVMLLDEPTSQLDEYTRRDIWNVLQRIWIERGGLLLHVTHDIEEAITLGTRVLVMQEGNVVLDQRLPGEYPRTLQRIHMSDFVNLRRAILESVGFAGSQPAAS